MADEPFPLTGEQARRLMRWLQARAATADPAPWPPCDSPWFPGPLTVARADDSVLVLPTTRIDVGLGLSLAQTGAGRVLIDWAGSAGSAYPAPISYVTVVNEFVNNTVVENETVNNLTVIQQFLPPEYGPPVTLPQLCGAGLFGLLKFNGQVGILWPGCGWQVLCSDCQPVEWLPPEPPPPTLPKPPPPPLPPIGGPPVPPVPPTGGPVVAGCVDPWSGEPFDPPNGLCLSAAGFSAPAGDPAVPGSGCQWGAGLQAINGVWPLTYGVQPQCGGLPYEDVTVTEGPCQMRWASSVSYPITASDDPGGIVGTGRFFWHASRLADGRWHANMFSTDHNGDLFGGIFGGDDPAGQLTDSPDYRSEVGPPTLPATLFLHGPASADCLNLPASITLSAPPCPPSPPNTTGPGTTGGPTGAPGPPATQCGCCEDGDTMPGALDLTLQARKQGDPGAWSTLLPSLSVKQAAAPSWDPTNVPCLWKLTAPVTLTNGCQVKVANAFCSGPSTGDWGVAVTTNPGSADVAFPSFNLPLGAPDPAAPCAPGSTMTFDLVWAIDGGKLGLLKGVLYDVRAVLTGY